MLGNYEIASLTRLRNPNQPNSAEKMVLQFLGIIICALYHVQTGDASAICQRSCGADSYTNVPFPFGFSSGCQIQLNCSSNGTMFIHDFPIQSITQDSIMVKLQAQCGRPIETIHSLFGHNYAPTSNNGILMENCSSPITACVIPGTAVNQNLQLPDCGTKTTNSMSCYSEQHNQSPFMKYDNLEKTSCDSVITSISIESSGHNSSSLSLNAQLMQLGWWLEGYCQCSEHSNCTYISSPADGKPGYRCQCLEGYVGDGYIAGMGCRKESTGCHGAKYLSGQCGGTTRPGVLIGGTAAAVGVLVAVCSWCYVVYRKRKMMLLREKFFRENGGLILQKQLKGQEKSSNTTKIFTAKELKTATNNFNESKIIGQGGFGIVYKGCLTDNREVAIKKSKIIDHNQIGQFINELVILSQVNHKNVVKLLGCCLETEVPLLVYEFINNGTLFKHLHDKKMARKISWDIRLKIAAETAEAISYLHSAASPPIIHRDIKTMNILLDQNYMAKVSDFGASRLGPLDQNQLSSMVQGTRGYLDPEFFQTFQLTEKSDVYSFGVVLVELLTGKMPVGFDRTQNEINLSNHFLSSLKQNRLTEILEDFIVSEENIDQLMQVASMAERCLNVKGEDRPSMKEVAIALVELVIESEHGWVQTAQACEDDIEAPLNSLQY